MEPRMEALVTGVARGTGKTAALLVSFFVLTSPQAASAESHEPEEDPGLSRVTFHTDYTSDKRAEVLRDGMEIAWELLAPYLQDHGFDRFPASAHPRGSRWRWCTRRLTSHRTLCVLWTATRCA
jgi:hypothetical protein